MPQIAPSKRPDPRELATLIEENLAAKSLDFARLPGGHAHVGNPTWFTSGLRRAGYNGVTQACFTPDQLDEQIETTLAPFRQNGIPLTWWVGSLSEPSGLGRALQAHGFTHNRDMIGMAAPLSELQQAVLPDDDYSFDPVVDSADLKAWIPLLMETFGMPASDLELITSVFAQMTFAPGSAWRHYAIRHRGQVLAISSLHFGGGVAGLYNVGTRPEFRQHGLGTTITLRTFEQARQMGYAIGTLQTTYPNALRLYHRLGFEVFCKIGVYQRGW